MISSLVILWDRPRGGVTWTGRDPETLEGWRERPNRPGDPGEPSLPSGPTKIPDLCMSHAEALQPSGAPDGGLSR